MSNARGVFILLILTIVAGCKVGPDYRAPKVELSDRWVGPTTAPTTQGSKATTRPVEITQWWSTFNDPVLDSLIERAIEENLDLKQATARIRQARAARGVVSSGLWPAADASGAYRRSGSGDNNGINGGSNLRDLYQAGLDAAWELDVFGGTRRSVEAADADIRTAVEDRRDVFVTLAAEVALNYVDLRLLQRGIVIATENLATQQRSAGVTKRLRAAEFVNGLDVANAEALVATTAAQIPLLEAAAQQTIYNLSVLLAQEPGSLVDELSPAKPIPITPKDVPMGLPSELLRRRPDIRRLEAQVHAATARIGVATSDLFPRFSLTGSLGLEGDNAKSLTNWGNRFWSVGPSVSWPLFSAGRIRSNIAFQDAAAEEVLLAYRAAILNALRDVETALIAYYKEQQRRQALGDAVIANRRAVDLSTQLYTQGQTDFLNVLSAQRALLSSEDALAQSDRSIATNLIALYKALGGGWEVAR